MAYTTAPANAWAGWRYRIQGGPIGGQYHGFIAPDETVDYAGWPAGPNEMFRKLDDARGLGIYPWDDWNKHGVGHRTQSGAAPGVPLMEGQTPSDYVYRSTAEVRPRPNASGGHNVVRAVQYQRTAGYAVAPGNYKTLSGLGAVANPTGNVPVYSGGGSIVGYEPGTVPTTGPVTRWPPKVCPAWGCGPPRFLGPPIVSPAPSPSVPQTPPPTQPGPTSTVPMGPAGSSGCAPGQYRDAAGNCTSDWTNPYSMYLPLDSTPAPSPVVSANTCPTGYYMEASGNCVEQCQPGEAPDSSNNCVPALPDSSVTGIEGWLTTTMPFMGYNVPYWAWIAAGVVAFRMLGGKRKR